MREQPPPRPDSRPPAETAPGVRVARRAADDADLATVWRERAIDLRRLNRPLRLAAAAVVLAALLAAALIVLRDAPQPRLTIDVDSNHPNVPIPTAAFVVAFALWLVAWSSALAGALHGHWAFRLLVGAAFVYIAIEVVIFNALSLVYIAPLIVVAAWMLAVSAWQWGARRAGRTLPSWFPAVSFGVILVCFAAHYALIWLLGKQATEVLGKQAGDLARVFSELVTLEYEAYGFVLLPILFLTGSDLAEWGEAAAGQLNALLRRFRSPWPLVGVTLLASAAILVYRLIQRGTFAPFDLPSVADLVTLGLFGIIAALLFLGAARLGRAARWSRLPTPAGALVVTTAAVMALLTGPAYLTDFLISLNPTPAGYDV
ncbi:MAG TPA: hypothetical protein VGS80_13660, partial [Ktedonobacterales bacterium]|nr:hypothetical protein [Ktedonobacterales bacterium]